MVPRNTFLVCLLVSLLTNCALTGDHEDSKDTSPSHTGATTGDPKTEELRIPLILLIVLPLIFSLISAGTAAGLAVVVMKMEMPHIKNVEKAAFSVMDEVVRTLIPGQLLNKIGSKIDESQESVQAEAPVVPSVNNTT